MINITLPEKQALPCRQTLPCALARQRFLCRATDIQSTAMTQRTAKPPKNTWQRCRHDRGGSKRTAKKEGTATAQESARQRYRTRQSRPPLLCTVTLPCAVFTCTACSPLPCALLYHTAKGPLLCGSPLPCANHLFKKKSFLFYSFYYLCLFLN
jgi:hypothetical protein